MSYSTDDDVYLAYGRNNVHKWGDLNNNGVLAEILARIEWARESAYAWLNDRLRKSMYQFPLADPGSGGSYPATLVRMEAYYAGVLLYESRGVTDVNQVTGAPMHALHYQKKQVDAFVADLVSRRITLDVAPPIETTHVPIVENDHDTDDDASWSEEDEVNAWWP